MKSVTDQILGDGALDRIISEGITTPDEDNVRKITDTPEAPEAHDPQALANAKLRVAFATREQQHAPKATGVYFKSTAQVQMIYDDGSVRNPFKKVKMSSRQKRKLRKSSNRIMRKRGAAPGTDLRLILKGRQSDDVRLREGTDEKA